MSDPAPTPNIHLQPINANRRTWADIMNENLILIDAVMGTFFIVQNLQGAWQNSTTYTVGQAVVDLDSAVVWQCQVPHVSASIPSTFAEDRAANPSYWTVYSSPARARGVWLENTNYAINDFVVNGSQYAIAVQTHTSTSSFSNDLASGFWSVLVDLSQVGSQVLPVPGGAGDEYKIVATSGSGNGYNIYSQSDALIHLLGSTTIGTAVLQAANQNAALAAIGAQAAGSYQAASSNLATLSAATLGVYGLTVLSMASVASLQTSLGLGTAAYLSASNIALLASPAFSGTPTAPTAAQGDNSTKLATTAYADRIGVQQIVVQQTGAVLTGSTGIIVDDTPPQQSAEGTEFLQATITPKSATSKLIIEAALFVNQNAASANNIIAALFQDATEDALTVALQFVEEQFETICLKIIYEMTSGTTSATTFKVKAGTQTSVPATVTVNGVNGSRLFGGKMLSSLIITEIGA